VALCLVCVTLCWFVACNDTGTSVSCESPSDCEQGQICHQGTCWDTCDSEADCGVGELCAHGVCVPQVDSGPTDGGPGDTAAPDASEVDAAATDSGLPDGADLDAAAADVRAFDTALPDVNGTDAAPPDTAQPDTAQPDTAQPDTAQPDTAQPDTALPDTALPDTALPDVVLPDVNLPDTVLLDAAGSVCGNGDLEPGERCDDHNNGSGDGCSASCDFELDFGRVAYLRFDNDLLDDSGLSNHADPIGSPVFGAGLAGSGLAFNLNNDYALIPDTDSLDLPDQVTLLLWFRPAAVPSDFGRLVSKGSNTSSNTANYGIWTGQDGTGQADNYRYRFVSYDGEMTSVPSLSAMVPDTWHHIGASFDGGLVRIYFDGAIDNEELVAVSVLPLNGLGVAIGYDHVRNMWPTSGTIDEIMIYDRALTPAEVVAIYAELAP